MPDNLLNPIYSSPAEATPRPASLPPQGLGLLNGMPPSQLAAMQPMQPVPTGNEVEEPPPVPMRAFTDGAAMRQAVFDRALTAMQNIQPMRNDKFTVRLTDVHYDGPDHYSLAAQKKAILNRQSLGRKLRGTWELYDNATGMLAEKKKTTLASVPYFTDRGTAIYRGSEYTLNNQLRLKPGVFTRIRDNGEVESHINVLPGKGPSSRVYLDPEKGEFYMKISQAKLPLLPILNALGATSSDIREAWGGELYAANAASKDSHHALDRIYKRVVRRKDDNPTYERKLEQIKETFEKMELDPEVTESTLGAPYKNVNVETLLRITKKLVNVHKGDEEADDRDSLAYQVLYGPEDMIAERIEKDHGHLRRALMYKITGKQSLSPIFPNALGKQVDSAIMQSGLGQAAEEINAGELLDKMTKVTRLGEGGIPSIDSIPDEARSVQPTHFGFIEPLRTPESLRAGVDVFFSRGARKGADGNIYSKFRDAKTGKFVWRTPRQAASMTIAFPGEMNSDEPMVRAMRKGRLTFAKRDEVDMELPVYEEAFSPLGNLIPLKSALKGQRMAMASRMLTQALPLMNPEAPLVRGTLPGKENSSFEEMYGVNFGAIRASQPGEVLSVTPDEIKVRYADGKQATIDTANYMPYNRKTSMHQTATVKPGDVFRPGDLLARSNFTDDKGVAAVGLNVRVGYMTGRKAGTFEDAVEISESLAKRLNSEQTYQHDIEWNADNTIHGLKKYMSLFGKKFSKEQLQTLDDDGVVKQGQILRYGDPMVVMAKEKVRRADRVHRRAASSGFSDASQVWEHKHPGYVSDVVKTESGPVVVVRSQATVEVGDKLSGRYGDKGVVARITPDEEMPIDEDGKPLEMLVSDLGVISRTNPAQVFEAVLGKIAAKTGKPYNVPDFDKIKDMRAWVEEEARKNGVKDYVDLHDPVKNRKIKGVLTGNRFMMKLHHMAEGKAQVRGTEGGYTAQGEPAKGGDSGSKRLGVLGINALLSHGAIDVLRDTPLIKGQKNEDFWVAFMSGTTPPKPKVPQVYQKFVADLQGAGINVVPDGSGKLNIMAMTGADVDHLAGSREITNGETVHFDDNLTPIKGGLFDPTLTGGHDGNRWSYIKLHEPMPNPVMEDPIRILLGLTKEKFEAVLAGKEEYKGKTGPQAIAAALDSIQIGKEIAKERGIIKAGRKTQRDGAVRRLGYLMGARQTKIHPREWMLDKVPVLPPKFRPVSTMGDKELPLVSDANYLYRELLAANENLKDLSGKVGDVSDERRAVYDSFRAVVGLGDPTHPKLVEKKVKGILGHLFGDSPKMGTVQRKLISSTVDLVGRAAITPDADLDMDSVGIPEEKAWDLYKVFIVRQLRRRGMPLLQAAQHVKDKTPEAKRALLNEMSVRPVIIDRAPIWHRFGIMAFNPTLTKGHTLKVNPLIVSGFGADFDGDAMQFAVPVTDKEVENAYERMMPSKNLLSPADFKTPVAAPGKEFVTGLYKATVGTSSRRPRTFRSIEDAKRAYARGELDLTDPIEILQR